MIHTGPQKVKTKPGFSVDTSLRFGDEPLGPEFVKEAHESSLFGMIISGCNEPILLMANKHTVFHVAEMCFKTQTPFVVVTVHVNEERMEDDCKEDYENGVKAAEAQGKTVVPIIDWNLLKTALSTLTKFQEQKGAPDWLKEWDLNKLQMKEFDVIDMKGKFISKTIGHA